MNALSGVPGSRQFVSMFSNWNRLSIRWLLPLTFFAIGLIYLYASPNFESPDSLHHVGVIKWIAENGALPIQSPDHGHLYRHEGSQPPLYYLLMTPIWQAIDTSDFDQYYNRNPLAFIGNPALLGNRNRNFYRQPYPPLLRGTSLAILLIRLTTLGMATVAISAIYRAAYSLPLPSVYRRKHLALLATSLTAFNPQFLFVATSVSNDILATMLASLIIWQLLLMLRDGFQTRRSLLLALLLALVAMTKLSGLVLGVVVLVAAVWLLVRSHDRRGFAVLAGSTLLLSLLISFWWYARNLQLYGDLFGTVALLDHYGRRSTTLLKLIVEEFEGFRISYWGLFGWFSIYTNEVHYMFMDVVSILAFAGLVFHLVKNRGNKSITTVILILCFSAICGLASLIWYSLQSLSSQGRLLFPQVATISLLMATGVTALRIPPKLVCAPMMAFCVTAPFLYIIPAYDHPQQVEQLPNSAIRTFAQ